MRVLRSRLYEMTRKAQAGDRRERRARSKTGDRSEKIRTITIPKPRNDHRIGLTIHQLTEVNGRQTRPSSRWPRRNTTKPPA